MSVVNATASPARGTARKLLPWLGLAFAIYVLRPYVGQTHATFDALTHARLAWLAVVGLASAGTYLMAAVALIGVARVPLALRRTWAVQVAAAFTNRLAPAGLGGMATNVRYLVTAGSDRTAAVTAVGLNSVAGFLVHVIGVGGVVALLGTGHGIRPPSGPDITDYWPVVLAMLGVVVEAGAIRWGRRVARLVGPQLRSLGADLRAVAVDPKRAVGLFGGSVGVTAGYAIGLVASVNALGGGVGVGKVVAVYLGGAAIASIAPTPGGLGPLEATFVTGLSAAGMASAQAVAAVLVYRSVTYWTPVLPGVALYRVLRDRAVL
jgi:undecaprenyl-diphosphatase